MTSKERMLRAIHREKPDRLPVTIHQWQPYHLNVFMGGMTDIEAFRAVGLDASINYYETIDEPCADWRVSARVEKSASYDVTHYTITTPGGTLTTSEGKNAMTTWVMDPLVKRPENIHLIQKYRPVPRFNREGAFKTYEGAQGRRHPQDVPLRQAGWVLAGRLRAVRHGEHDLRRLRRTRLGA
jgi:hypothetical protein